MVRCEKEQVGGVGLLIIWPLRMMTIPHIYGCLSYTVSVVATCVYREKQEALGRAIEEGRVP